MRKTILTILALLGLLVAFLLIKTFTHPFADNKVMVAEESVEWSITDEALLRLAGGIQIPTVSTQVYEETDFVPFDLFKEYLIESYPVIFSTMDTVTINNYGLVFKWSGKNSGLEPLLFLAHYDVVPVAGFDSESLSYEGERIFNPTDKPVAPISEVPVEWDYHPFSGAVADGRVYGRGTLDDKSILFALLEAATDLINDGFVPEQDIWFAFGHDEEVGGVQGATKIANYFKESQQMFGAVYDEGGIITAPGVGGVNRSLALVGTAEKGGVSLRIVVRGLGGHSSMPPSKSSLVLAAEVIEKLNDNQLPARLIPPVASFLDRVGAEMNFPSRMAIANQWLLQPVLFKVFSGNSATNALVRTTTAITMTKGSDAANVLSSTAEVVVNFRLLPGDSISTVLTHIEHLCKDYDVDVEMISAHEASSVSPIETPRFEIIKEAVEQLYPQTITTPYITIAGTDAYKYQGVSDYIYRLMPVYLNDWEKDTMHNENEYISIENYAKMIGFYKILFAQ